MEEWKDIPGWEGYYQASNMGRIKSVPRLVGYRGNRFRTYKSTILKQYNSDNSGYKVVYLSRNRIVKIKDSHRLIAITFLPNPENKRCVNHKNGNKHDNRIENLEWNTYTENRIHAMEMGLSDDRGEKSKNSKLKPEQVLEMRKLRYEKGLKVSEISQLFPIVHRDYIRLILNRKRWKHI